MEKKFKNRQNTCIKQDGKEYWLSRSCSVNGLVVARDYVIYPNSYIDRVLIVKRGKGCKDNVGKYCLPCGYLDYDESCYEAFLREVYEETGLDIIKYEDLILLKNNIINDEIQPDFVFSTPVGNVQNVALFYKIIFDISDNKKILETSLENNEPDEIDEAIWINTRDVDKYDFCYGHDKIIKNINILTR